MFYGLHTLWDFSIILELLSIKLKGFYKRYYAIECINQRLDYWWQLAICSSIYISRINKELYTKIGRTITVSVMEI